jgi:hypothetical protein
LRTLILIPVTTCLLLDACATGGKMRSLEPGMTQEQVISMLGRPDGFQQSGNYEAYFYSNRLMSDWAWDRADYWVVFRNGHVVQYGPGEIRPGPQPNTLVVVPLLPAR